MSRKNERDLWRELEKFAYVAFGFVTVLLIAVYFVVSGIMPDSGSAMSVAQTFVLDIVPDLIAFFLILVGSYALFRRIRTIRGEKETGELATRIASAVTDRMRHDDLMAEMASDTREALDIDDLMIRIQSAIRSAIPPSDDLRFWETRDSRGKAGGFEQIAGLARREILTGSINFETTAERYLGVLTQKAKEGCEVKFVTIRPRMPTGEINPVVAATAKTIATQPEVLAEGIERNLSKIWRARGRLPEDKRTLWQIRVHEAIGAIFLAADGKEDHGMLLFSIYPYGIDSNNEWPIIDLKPTYGRGDVYRRLYESFSRMFDEGVEWTPDMQS